MLASSSPRRRELLSLTGLSFTVEPSDYEEVLSTEISPRLLARRLSRAKARAVSGRHKNAIVIGADTFIVFGKRILGKPSDKTEAKRLIRLLSGKSHSVVTGFTIVDTLTGKWLSRSVETRVWFRRLTEKEISSYAETGEPLDKAGAYAIQGLGSLLVEKIQGDYFNVVGLPLGPLMESLKKFGVRVL